MLFCNINFSFPQYGTSRQSEKDLINNLCGDLFYNARTYFHFQIEKLNFEKKKSWK